MVQDILTGIKRRRRWSVEEKVAILEEVRTSGRTVAEVARRHGITRQHVYQWRAEMRRKGVLATSRQVLVPVEVSAEAGSPPGLWNEGAASAEAQVEIVLGNGRRLRVCDHASDGLVRRMVRVLEAP